jgi:hypothetical protein
VPFATDRYLDLDAALPADIDLLHRQRISLKQPTDHLGCRHDRLGATPLHPVFSASALIRALTRLSSLVCLKV